MSRTKRKVRNPKEEQEGQLVLSSAIVVDRSFFNPGRQVRLAEPFTSFAVYENSPISERLPDEVLCAGRDWDKLCRQIAELDQNIIRFFLVPNADEFREPPPTESPFESLLRVADFDFSNSQIFERQWVAFQRYMDRANYEDEINIDVKQLSEDYEVLLAKIEEFKRRKQLALMKLESVALSDEVEVWQDDLDESSYFLKRLERLQKLIEAKLKAETLQHKDPRYPISSSDGGFNPNEFGGKELCIIVSYHKAVGRKNLGLLRKKLKNKAQVERSEKSFRNHCYKQKKKAEEKGWYAHIPPDYYKKYW